MNTQDYGNNFIRIIPVNRKVHTPENPHCSDTDCPCYDELKDELTQQYQDGLVSHGDATRILNGKQVWQL